MLRSVFKASLVAAALFPAAAFAVTTNLGTLSSSNTTLASPVVSFVDTFSDTYTFNALNNLEVQAVSVTFNSAMTSVLFTLWDMTTPGSIDLVAQRSTNGPIDTWSTSGFSVLDGHSYELLLSGAGSGAGIYTLAINAVPEPETYAMLLAGLGMLGALGRRRRQSTH